VQAYKKVKKEKEDAKNRPRRVRAVDPHAKRLAVCIGGWTGRKASVLVRESAVFRVIHWSMVCFSLLGPGGASGSVRVKLLDSNTVKYDQYEDISVTRCFILIDRTWPARTHSSSTQCTVHMFSLNRCELIPRKHATMNE
jgi:hypothetical protein